MNSTSTQSHAEPTLWHILNPIQIHELSNAKHVGDNQHRCPLTVRLQSRGNIKNTLLPMKLRIESSRRWDETGYTYEFEGFLETRRGLVAVEGFIKTLSPDSTGHGHLQVKQVKTCPQCEDCDQVPLPSRLLRCQNCGAKVVVCETPSIVQ